VKQAPLRKGAVGEAVSDTQGGRQQPPLRTRAVAVRKESVTDVKCPLAWSCGVSTLRL
jgi:hypothetical protein